MALDSPAARYLLCYCCLGHDQGFCVYCLCGLVVICVPGRRQVHGKTGERLEELLDKAKECEAFVSAPVPPGRVVAFLWSDPQGCSVYCAPRQSDSYEGQEGWQDDVGQDTTHAEGYGRWKSHA